MAQTGWRCPNCDTANAPDARACAGCGRWPSLFDLESSQSRYRTDEEPSPVTEQTIEVGSFSRGAGDVRPAEPDAADDEEEAGEDTSSFPWGTALTIGIAALFLVVSWLSDQFG